MTYEVVDLVADGLPNGFGVIIKKRRKPAQLLLNGDSARFLFKSDAKAAGERFINSETVKQETKLASRS